MGARHSIASFATGTFASATKIGLLALVFLPVALVPGRVRSASARPIGIVSAPRAQAPVAHDGDVLAEEREENEIADAAEPARAPDKPAPRAAATAKTPSKEPPAPARPAADSTTVRAALAERIDELPMCRRGGPEGPGVAQVSFAPEGGAVVRLSEPYAGTPTGACVARRLSMAARPYDGPPMVVAVRFAL